MGLLNSKKSVNIVTDSKQKKKSAKNNCTEASIKVKEIKEVVTTEETVPQETETQIETPDVAQTNGSTVETTEVPLVQVSKVIQILRY